MINMSGGVGERVATLRKLAGWKQHQLATKAYVSTSLVKQVEQGRTPPSPAFVASCAQAFGVEVRELYGTRPDESVVELHNETAGIGQLREALHSYDDPAVEGQPLTLAALGTRMAGLEKRRRAQKFGDVIRVLPEALQHLYVRVDGTVAGTEDGDTARSMLHDGYRLAANVAQHFRHPDLAAMASERHISLAASTGDPLRVSLSDWHRSTQLLQNGHYARGIRLLDRALSRIPEGSSSKASGMAAQLHLRAGVMSARAGDTVRADEYIEAARALVRGGCDPHPFANTDATELNVTIHWCAVPVEVSDGSEAVRRGSRVSVVDRTRPERVGHHHIDQARAWLLHGNRDQTLTALNEARRISPQQTRTHPAVRETVRALAEADKRSTDSLAGFARWAGIRL